MRATGIGVLAVSALAAGLLAAPGSAGAGSTAGKISVTFLKVPPTKEGGAAVIPIRVTNKWPAKAIGVTLSVTAPSWVRLSAPRCVSRPAGLKCRLGDLAAGDDVTVRIRAKPSRRTAYHVVARASVTEIQSSSDATDRSVAVATSFRGVIAPISAALAQRMTGVSWRPSCPVGLSDLRSVKVTFWGFDATSHTGTLVVHRRVAAQVVRVMGRLYATRFPIRRMVPVDVYGGDDFRSIEADNTSAFNCRAATGGSRWSEHAYGRAIDLNPLENPYVSGGSTSHSASRRYLDRSLRLPGMVHAGDAAVRAFAAEGWGWGGVWSGVRDYQHFSLNAR